MRSTALITAITALALLTTGCTGGALGDANSKGPWTLRIDVEEGDAWTYRSTLENSIGEGEAAGTLTVVVDTTMTVLSVEDGKTTMKIVTEPVSVDATGALKGLAGMTKDALAQTQKVTFDERGAVVSGASTQLGMTLPEEPVEIGDSWAAEATLPGGGKMTATNKVVAVEEIEGRRTLKIEVTDVESGEIETTGPMFYWVDPETGMNVKSNATITVQTGGQEATTVVETELK